MLTKLIFEFTMNHQRLLQKLLGTQESGVSVWAMWREIRLIVLCVIFGSFIIELPDARAQGITDEQIQKTVEMLRANGQSEEQIEKVIQGMKQAQEFTKAMSDAQKDGASEEQAARKAAGFSDKEIADMEAIEKSATSMDAKVQQLSLDRSIVNFRQEHGDKPDVTVTIGDESFVLKLLHCQREGELFSLSAEGEPVRNRRAGPRLNARRSPAYGQGGYYESISFDDGQENYSGVDQTTGEFTGNKFNFEGISNIQWKGKQKVIFKVSAICDL